MIITTSKVRTGWIMRLCLRKRTNNRHSPQFSLVDRAHKTIRLPYVTIMWQWKSDHGISPCYQSMPQPLCSTWSKGETLSISVFQPLTIIDTVVNVTISPGPEQGTMEFRECPVNQLLLLGKPSKWSMGDFHSFLMRPWKGSKSKLCVTLA